MKQFVPVAHAGHLQPSLFNRVANWLSRAIDSVLNTIFSLTHAASVTRWRVLLLGFFLAWLFAILISLPAAMFQQQIANFLAALLAAGQGNLQPLQTVFVQFLFTVVFHPAVIKHVLALVAPFWLMHRIAAIYLADIFEEPSQATARHFVMESAFGRGYRTLNIKQGMVDDQDAKSSTIIKIGGPGYVKVELDSAALFERPDGTPHVILPGQKEIIDDFERLRRVVDVRDSIEMIDLPPTRTKDGIFVGAKNIQFSYSVYRGESPDRKKSPYPCSPRAVENLVYKDGRSVKPKVAPARVPEWQLGQFKMGGAIAAEIGAFISKRSLSDFLATIGEPEQDSLLTREREIAQTSQNLAGAGDSPSIQKPPLEVTNTFSPRTVLTDAFYNQEDFVKRMTEKGFQLNWIGVGTWDTPAEIIPANHREAWKISRDNLARGSRGALDSVKNEATLQELLRLVQIPVAQFVRNLHLIQSGDEKPLDDILQEYEDILRLALELYQRGTDSIPSGLNRLGQKAVKLTERISYPTTSEYDEFLKTIAHLFENGGLNQAYWSIEELLQPAGFLYETLQTLLTAEDKDFLLQANQVYENIRNHNQIQRVADVLANGRRFHWVQGPNA